MSGTAAGSKLQAAAAASGAGSAAEPLMWTAAAASSRGFRGTSRSAVLAASSDSSAQLPLDDMGLPNTAVATLTAAPAALAATSSAPAAARLGGFTFPIGPVRAAVMAAQAYIYGYPLLAVQRVQALLGPLNTLNLNTSFANPDAEPFWKAIGGGTHPNVNVLYSLASLDLRDGPVVLTIPDMGERYYSFQLTDPYINVDNYISSNPTEANPVGGQGPASYAITWIGNQIAVPGAETVLVDYPSELLLGRVEATPADQQQVVDLMTQWTLTPTGSTSVNNAVIPSAYLSPIAVLNAISTAITQNPPYPPEQDAAELAKLARIGVGPDPNDPTTALQVADRLGPLSQLAAAAAVQLTSLLLPPLTDAIQNLSAIRHRGWAVTQPEIGDFGTNYLYRAGVAYVGLVANTPDQALYYPGMRDSNYLPLNGKHSYVLHFAPGQAPPTDAGGFWSLTVYNSAGQLVNSAAPNVYSNGPLVTRPDGSIDVILSQQNPADAGANWLQVPAGEFSVYLRIYAPEPAAYEGTWLPPGIKRTSGLFRG
ncbi:MAG: DUF1254 domain-containing protein [Mycobacterium sp.]|nr:DUF1254 domain-containing protein [Mycobacterium sp.]